MTKKTAGTKQCQAIYTISVLEFGVVAFAEVVFEHAAHTVEQTDVGKFGDDKVVN